MTPTECPACAGLTKGHWTHLCDKHLAEATITKARTL